MNNKKLQVGDKIAVYYSGKPQRMITVNRVTDTSAFTKDTRFKRDIGSNGYLTEVPQIKWTQTTYKISTPELEAKFYEVKLDKYISRQVQENKHQKLPLSVKEEFVKELKKLEQ